MKGEASRSRINLYDLLIQNLDSTRFPQAGGEMPELGISEGDYIVTERQDDALNGKLVAASPDGELRILKVKRAVVTYLEWDGKSLEITGWEHVFTEGNAAVYFNCFGIGG